MAQVSSPSPVAQSPSVSLPSETNTFKQKFSKVWNTAKKYLSTNPLISGLPNPFSASPKNPEDALQKIQQKATEVLRNATLHGIRETTSVEGSFHAQLNEALERARGPSTAEGEVTVERGENAQALGIDDPQVTLAIPPSTRTAQTHWPTERRKYQADLTQKLTALSAAQQMREKIVGDIEAAITKLQSKPDFDPVRDTPILRNLEIQLDENNAKLLRIAEQATRPGETKSLWDLFVEHYPDLTLMEKLKIGLFYWCYYKTSLLGNTIQTYLEKFLNKMARNTESDATRARLIASILKNANEFLVEDIRAIREFAHDNVPGGGDLGIYRTRAVMKNYSSLEALCKAFSEKRVEEDAPIVPFFKHLKKIPVLGYFFEVFEKLINRYIIQKSMKSSILPQALLSAVRKGVNATQPHNLPFSIALTRFFNEQLEKLRARFDDPTPSAIPPSLPGIDLSTLTGNLMTVLDLENLESKTQIALRKKFKEFDEEKSYFDKQMDESIQEGIKVGCHFLFDYLNKAIQSEELFANLLKLSCDPFYSQSRDFTSLMAEYNEEHAKLERNASGLFEKIIHQAVAKKVNGITPEEAKQETDKAFNEVKTITKETFDRLHLISRQMATKVDLSLHDSGENNSIRQELASFSQIMQAFAKRKELREKVNGLPKSDKEAIWHLVTPFYEKAENLQGKILELQKSEDKYLAHANICSNLKLIKELTETIYEQFRAQPRHLRNPLIQSLKTHWEEIQKSLGRDAAVTRYLREQIEAITAFSDKIAKEQQVIDAIHEFSPPREGGELQAEGLLDQLLSYELGRHPSGFQPRTCLKKIGEKLAYFSPEEQRELRELIGTGSNLRARWDRLSTALQRIYENHRAAKDQNGAELSQVLNVTSQWTQEKLDRYTEIANENHAAMQREMNEISIDVTHLHGVAMRMKPELPLYLTSERKQWVAAAAAGATSLGLTVGMPALLGGGWLSYATQIVTSGLASSLYMARNSLAGLTKKEPVAMAKAAASFAAGSIAASVSPTLVPVAATAVSALTGYQYQQAAHTYGQDKVLPAIRDLFKNGYKMILSPRIYLATTTRAMKEMTEESPE